MIFSCDTDITVWPIRFAGTCSRYSNNATPQLTSAATNHGFELSSLRCAYQANVMKTFDRISRMTVWAVAGTNAPYGFLGGPITKIVLPDGSLKPKVRAFQYSSRGGLGIETFEDHSE